MDWTEMSAAALGRAIGAGEIDPVDLTEYFLTKIDAHPQTPRIYARVMHDRARAEAAAARLRAQAGRRLSPLDGVPISWKDLFDTAGVATEAGSALLAGRVPQGDALVLQRASAAGLVCLGKTHMSELAFSGLGLNPVTETTPCVNDLEAVSGGSSSGAAGSVAFGLAAAGIGSDTGGSVRVPAAWNDLVGLKTTAGRVSLQGVVPLCRRFDTIGPLTRTVEDAALLLAAIEGTAPMDMTGSGSLRGRRFAVLKTVVEDDAREAPIAAYHSAQERLQAAGARLEAVEAPELLGPMADAGVLYTAEAWAEWGAVISERGALMFDRVRERFEAGGSFAAADYIRAWDAMEAARREWAARFAGFDAVLCPSAPILPPKTQRLMEEPDHYVSENLMALRNTRVGNLMGLSAVTLPTGVPSCGIMLMGPARGEERLLRVAAEAEAALS